MPFWTNTVQFRKCSTMHCPFPDPTDRPTNRSNTGGEFNRNWETATHALPHQPPNRRHIPGGSIFSSLHGRECTGEECEGAQRTVRRKLCGGLRNLRRCVALPNTLLPKFGLHGNRESKTSDILPLGEYQSRLRLVEVPTRHGVCCCSPRPWALK